MLPVVPMFHANAWGFPFTCTFVGAKQVFPGPFLDGESLLEAFQQEQVTITAGVPTIWMGILQELDANPGKYDTSSVRSMVVGGSAAPQAMIEAFEKRHGLSILHAWGMTEMCPLGTVSELTSRERELSEEEQFRYRAKQGIPAAFVEIRARGPEGLVPWDGESMGELEVRGVWISNAYYDSSRGRRSLDRRRLVQDRRHRDHRAARLHRDPGPLEGSRQVRRRVDLDRRARERADGPSRDRRGGRDRRSRTRSGRSGRSRSASCGKARRRPTTSCGSSSRRTSRSGGCRSASRSSRRSRRRRSASSARPRFASSSRRSPSRAETA